MICSSVNCPRFIVCSPFGTVVILSENSHSSWISFTGQGQLERYGDEFFERLFHPHVLVEMAERNPEAALNLLQLAREFGSSRWLERHGDEFFERVFHPRTLMEMVERNPEAALNLLQLAREFGSSRWLERHEDELVKLIFIPSALTRLLLTKPRIFVEALRFVQGSISKTALHGLQQSLASFLDRPDGEKAILKQIPLEGLPELQWIAQTMKDKKLSLVLEQILSDIKTKD